MNQVYQSMGKQLVTITIILSLLLSSYACNQESTLEDSPKLNAWLNDISTPPITTEADLIKRQKADVIVLPSITITVWAIGAITAYIGAQLVYQSTASDMSYLMGNVFGESHQWEDIDWKTETQVQAEHMQSSLELIAYRSPSSDFYAITGNDYLRILNQAYHTTIIDPGELKKMLDGKVRPLAGYAKAYFEALRELSMTARHFEQASDGMCVTAEVTAIQGGIPYIGMAKANNHIDIIPAAILASLKATTRCGMYDSNIREFVHGFFQVSDQRGAIVDIFISHTLRTARLLYKYVDVCQLPPKLSVNLDVNSCHDIFE